MGATLDDYRWLVSEAAEAWLAAAREEMARAGSATAGIVSRLRKQLSSRRAHLVVEQVELRERAREKFTLAERMFFTRKGLEQATDERLAQYKASMFPPGEPVADLCCGIGGDLISLVARGPAKGVDSDPVAALLAAANVLAHGLQSAPCSVVAEDAVQFPISGRGWHCDPDRRAEGRRTTRGELFEPTFEALAGLLQQNKDAAIKLAPATKVPAAWSDIAELEWLGSRGECRQQVAWFGRLARHPGRRAATVISACGQPRTVVESADEVPAQGAKLGRYIYEPDAAVLAAKLEGELCREHSLAAISPGIAYLTSDGLIEDAALAAFEVIDVLPLDRKQLKAYCRERKLGRLEIKKRGIEVDPQRLRKEIAAAGDNDATFLIAPVAGKVRAIAARRLPASRA